MKMKLVVIQLKIIMKMNHENSYNWSSYNYVIKFRILFYIKKFYNLAHATLFFSIQIGPYINK